MAKKKVAKKSVKKSAPRKAVKKSAPQKAAAPKVAKAAKRPRKSAKKKTPTKVVLAGKSFKIRVPLRTGAGGGRPGGGATAELTEALESAFIRGTTPKRGKR